MNEQPYHVEIVPIAEIVSSPYYPVSPDYPEVVEDAESYLTHGQETPIVITGDGHVVATEHCFAAMKRAGFRHVLCIRFWVRRGDPKFLSLMYEVARERVEEFDGLPQEEGLTGKAWTTCVHGHAEELNDQERLLGYINRIVEPLIGFWPLSVLEIHQLLNRIEPAHLRKEGHGFDQKVTYLDLAELLRLGAQAGMLAPGAVAFGTGRNSLHELIVEGKITSSWLREGAGATPIPQINYQGVLRYVEESGAGTEPTQGMQG